MTRQHKATGKEIR